jgi:hypothetical protein
MRLPKDPKKFIIDIFIVVSLSLTLLRVLSREVVSLFE